MAKYDFEVIGYAYRGNTYCKDCIVQALKRHGDVYRKHPVVDLEATLNALYENKGYERYDVWDSPNDDVPKEIFDIDMEYDIDICKICDKIIGS